MKKKKKTDLQQSIMEEKNDIETSTGDSKFTLLDVIRIIGGLLLLNAFLSWWFTSTGTWGYDGKWLDIRYLQFQLRRDYVNLTLDELKLYNGKNPKYPIYLAINGKVYDVTYGRDIYGPNGPYEFFSGRDSARAFVTGCFDKPDEFTHDLRGLDQEEAMHDITSWQRFFENHPHYWYAGIVTHKPIEKDIPSPCEHKKFPGYHVRNT